MNIAIIFPKLRGYYERVEYWDNTNRGEVELIDMNQLISLLEKNNHKVDLFMENYNIEKVDFIDAVREQQYDFLAIYPDYSSLINVAKMVKKIKRFSPKTSVAIFGYYATLNYENIMQIMHGIDLAIIGIDEYPFLQVLDQLEKKDNLTEIKGTVSYFDGKCFVNEPSKKYSLGFKDIPWPKRYRKDQKKVEIITINGCLGNCIFCENAVARKNIGFHDIRFRDVFDVVEEIEYLVSKRGVETIHIQDDSFFLYTNKRREWLEEFYYLMKEKGVNVSFVAHARTTDLLKLGDLLGKMKEIGLYRILIGVENFVQEKLDFFRKGITPEDNRKAIELLQGSGLEIGMGFLMFDPFTKLWQVKENLEIIYNNKYYVHFLGVANYDSFPIDSVIGLVPGSDILQMTEDRGLINHSNWYGYEFESSEVRMYYLILENWALKGSSLNGEVSRMNTSTANLRYDDICTQNIFRVANYIKKNNFEHLIELCDLVMEQGDTLDYETYIQQWEKSKEKAYNKLQLLKKTQEFNAG